MTKEKPLSDLEMDRDDWRKKYIKLQKEYKEKVERFNEREIDVSDLNIAQRKLNAINNRERKAVDEIFGEFK